MIWMYTPGCAKCFRNGTRGFAAFPGFSGRRKSSPAAIFSAEDCAVRLLAHGSPGGERRKETLLRKASETGVHAAGFGTRVGGLRPSKPPMGFIDRLKTAMR